MTPAQVLERMPDIIIGSWCGKKFQPEQVKAREGWHEIPAVKNGLIFEIKSADILQPGPSVFTYGLTQLQNIMQQWEKSQ
jgi:iron complex transport system substrate-binding protein